jgi:arabinoxylan arabinofuranohydrolase
MHLSDLQDGDWVRLVGVDFGSDGPEKFTARVAANAGTGGTIEIRLGSPEGTLVGTCPVPETGGWQQWTDVAAEVRGARGVQDLYLKFTGSAESLFHVDHWQFE